MPFFPLGGAFPGVPKVTDQPEVIDAATALGVTAAQVGLAWMLAHDPGTLLIPGTTSPDHPIANLAAGEVALPPETIAALDGIAAEHARR